MQGTRPLRLSRQKESIESDEGEKRLSAEHKRLTASLSHVALFILSTSLPLTRSAPKPFPSAAGVTSVSGLDANSYRAGSPSERQRSIAGGRGEGDGGWGGGGQEGETKGLVSDIWNNFGSRSFSCIPLLEVVSRPSPQGLCPNCLGIVV